ncbi:iron-containing redox enzyme family protein [Pseudaeromonas sp. ZJS20]|uniref:TenA family transcriptional regulator n=1 Tax=Pseudaeromonas aegiceratis TaxID=3153928 RepID=UPI00390C81F1
MSFYAQLLNDTRAEREYLLSAPAILACQRGEITLPRYLAFLTQAYYHVRQTVPLLMACGSRLDERHRWLFDAITEYIEEERGHDRWILSDIAQAGGDAAAVASGMPALATELMVSYAWDSIQRGNPVSFFGMVLVLEGTSVNLATAMGQLIQRTLGLPDSAMSYLYSHGSLDQDHIRFFETLMDRLDSPSDQAAVTHMARVMYRLYGDVFRSLPMEAMADAA